MQASQERRATQSRTEAFPPSLAQIPVAEQDRLQDLWKEEEAGIQEFCVLTCLRLPGLPVPACSCPDPAQAKGIADSKFGEEENI